MTNWRFNDEELKRILSRNNDPDNEGQSVANTIKDLLPHLKQTPCFARLPKDVITSLEQATTFHTFNRVLDRIYNFADDNLIWLGFMPTD